MIAISKNISYWYNDIHDEKLNKLEQIKIFLKDKVFLV